jgi:hypothetical protein
MNLQQPIHEDASFPKATHDLVEKVLVHRCRMALLPEYKGSPGSVIMLGGPGQGKTSVAENQCPVIYAAVLSEKYGEQIDPEDILVSVFRPPEREGAEAAGPGVPDEDAETGAFIIRYTQAPDVTEMLSYRYPEGHKWADEPYRFHIMIQDEVASANEDVQKIYTNAFRKLARNIGLSKLVQDCWVLGTGNRPADKSGAFQLLAHFIDSTCVVDVVFEIKNWLRWAEKHNVTPVFRELMDLHHEQLVAEHVPVEYGNYPTPRSIVEADDLFRGYINSGEFDGTIPLHLEIAFAGMVGCKAARLIAEFIEESASKVPTFEEIIADPTGAPVPESWSYQHLAASRALHHVEDMSEVEAVFEYVLRLRPDLVVSLGVQLQRLIKSPQFGQVVMSDVFKRFRSQFSKYLED